MLSTSDGAATLTEFTARSIYESNKFMSSPPKLWIICGGGRHNKYLLDILKTRYELNIVIIDNIDLDGFKINGDFVEAQAFAFLAARSYYNLPLTSPSTTGVIQPVSGGAFYQA
jgi:anhydro-N-acetylmuramic acid kinase